MTTGLKSIIANRQNLVTSSTQNLVQKNAWKIATDLGKWLKIARNSDLPLKNSTVYSFDINKKIALKVDDIAIRSNKHALIHSLKNISSYSFTEAESVAQSRRGKTSEKNENINKQSNDAQKQHTISKQRANIRQPQLAELQNARQKLPSLVKQFSDTREALDQLIYADNNHEFEKIFQLKQNLAYYHYQLRDCEKSIFNIKQELRLPPNNADIEEKLKREERDTPANILNEYRQDISVWHQEERNKLAKLEIEIADIVASKIMQSTEHLYLPRDQAATPTKNQLSKTIEKLTQLLEHHQQAVECKSHIYNMHMKERALGSNTQYANIPSRQIADLDAAINETKKIAHALQVYQGKLELHG